MRKGQIKLLEQSKAQKYSDGCIKFLSREDIALKQLNYWFYMLYYCKDESEEWINLFVSINDNDILRIIRNYHINHDISLADLKQMITIDRICKFFSDDKIICKNLFDVEFVIRIGFKTPELLNIARVLKQSFEWFQILDIIEDFEKSLDCIDDYDNFFDKIQIDKTSDSSQIKNYLNNYTKDYIYEHSKIKLNSALPIPDEIKALDFHGYSAQINIKGYARKVNFDSPNAIYILYQPYDGIYISEDGQISIKQNDYSRKKTKKLIFCHKTKDFITGYKTKNDWRYKPTQLNELFDIISIYESEEDKCNAYNIIEYLCEKYNTLLFRDLYKDYLISGGLLLPILISEVWKYKTKNELFNLHYHMSLNGNWNKRNANLTYTILKLKSRMTDDALARAMQCKSNPKFKKVGKHRYVMAYILYEAIYNVNVGNCNNDSLLADAIYEEYASKKIRLSPERQTINAHNERHGNAKKNNRGKIKIKKKTKFRTLIDNMPENYELIKTYSRLLKEAIEQKHCVDEYADKINSDNCMIYSILYENERHTIEFIIINGLYTIAQCRKSCNRNANILLKTELSDILNNINKKLKKSRLQDDDIYDDE